MPVLTTVEQVPKYEGKMKIRGDLKEVEALITRMISIGNEFERMDSNWSHMKNNEDFSQIHKIEDLGKKSKLERIYADGRDMALFMSEALQSINYDFSEYPTLNIIVERFKDTWVYTDFTPIIEEANNTKDELGFNNWAFDQMISMFKKQVNLLQVISQTIDILKKSDLYKQESGEEMTKQTTAMNISKEEMMYYHVIIETSEKEKVGKTVKNKELCQLDKTEIDSIVQDVITPFSQNRRFQFNGYFLEPKEIKRLAVRQTTKSSEDLVKFEYDTMPEGVFVVISRENVVEYDKHSKDITTDLFKLAEPGVKASSPDTASTGTSLDKTKVFIVHGHDDAAKLSVARFIEQMNFKPIILHEQASGGKTIIEKIESYTEVGFGVVLYTPCDLGGKATVDPKLEKRARQNVVFEHGFLTAKLGRHNVCALVKGVIETPNDISGVVYVPLDEHDAWKMKLAKEMQNAGYTIDLNKVL